MYLLLKKFNDDLVSETEIFLSMFIKIVSPADGASSVTPWSDTAGSNQQQPQSHTQQQSSRESRPSISASNAAAVAAAASAAVGAAGASPMWMRVLALEILRGLCGDFDLLSKVWIRYDADEDSMPPHLSEDKASNGAPTMLRRPSRMPLPTSVFRTMVTALNRLATERPNLLGTGTTLVSGVPADPTAGDYTGSGVVDGIVGIAQQAASTVGVLAQQAGSLSVATASVKLQCIDQLDKADAPPIPESYAFLLTLQCLNAIADGFANATLPAYSSLMAHRIHDEGQDPQAPLPAPPALDLDTLPEEPAYTALRTTRSMADAGWPALLASLSFFLSTNLDDDLFTYTLTSYQNFMTACGVLGLDTPRDAFLVGLCKFAVPPAIVSNLASSDAAAGGQGRSQSSSILTAGSEALGLTSAQPVFMTLSTRNLLCLRSLVGVAQALAGSLKRMWFHVFEALQNADFVIRVNILRKQKKRTTAAGPGPTSPQKASNNPASAGQGSSSTATQPVVRHWPTDADEQASQQRSTRLFEVSRNLNDDAFKWFVGSLCRLDCEMIGVMGSYRNLNAA